MKTTKVFFMAALALMTAACSNEDNEITQQPQMVRGIPFTATISLGNSASTRALEEIAPNGDNPNGRIVATWAENEKVALIYTVGSTTYATPATVTPQTNGTATLSATLQSGAVNGSDVTIIYPASAVDETTKDIKTDFLTGQDGTLAGIAANFDVRKGTGKLSISGGKATVYDGTPGTLVKLENQYAILKFTLQDIRGAIGAADFKASELKVSSSTLNKFFSPSTASGEYYIALPGQTVLNVGAYWLNATIGDKAYVGKLRIDPAFTLGKGKFYPTTVQMATVGDYVLTSGKFAAATITENPVGDPVVAKISYVVNPSNAAANNHGLALALEDESPLAAGYGWQEAKELILSKCAPTSKTPVSDASWILPTKAQWGNMVGVNGAGSFAALRTLGNFTGYYYWTSTNYTEEGQTETVADPWWIVDFLQNKWGHNNVYSDVSIRLGLAF
ncbi:MAG: hypothetical protein IKO86_00105 [Prevotella sp.]|nr:hypothetical protein [Prevotella sp.]